MKKEHIAILVIAIALIIGIWWYSHSQSAKKEAARKAAEGSGGSGGGSGSSAGSAPSGVNISAFQLFANGKGESLSVDGKWGPKTAAAWAKWGTAFNASTGNTSGSTTPPAGSAIGKTATSAYSGIEVLSADGETYRKNYGTGDLIGKITNTTVLAYVYMGVTPYVRFNDDAPVYQIQLKKGISSDYYEVQTSGGKKYVLKSFVKI